MLSELLYGLESIGDNCEFGIVQRHHGVEPLGLLRWAGLKFDMLLNALDDGFAAMGRAENLRLRTLNTEYLVVDTSYGITYHPFVHVDRMTPDELIAREVVRIGFLRDKFLADLREARKILVFKQKDNLTEAAAHALLRRLAAYGPNKLLYVVATDDPKGDLAPGFCEDDAAILLVIDQPGSHQPLSHIRDRGSGDVEGIAQRVGRDALFLLL